MALVIIGPALDIRAEAVFTNFVVSLMLLWIALRNKVIACKLLPLFLLSEELS